MSIPKRILCCLTLLATSYAAPEAFCIKDRETACIAGGFCPGAAIETKSAGEILYLVEQS